METWSDIETFKAVCHHRLTLVDTAKKLWTGYMKVVFSVDACELFVRLVFTYSVFISISLCVSLSLSLSLCV